jgi:reversibly glycosylated polypeptide / UDP-arabinopyranose mutase
MKIALVVPTIRKDCIDLFLNLWSEYFSVIVVEDNPKPTFDVRCFFHFSWRDIVNDFGNQSWIISRRDSGIKCYGFLKAYQMGFDVIYCLDDDCLPLTEDVLSFQKQHANNLFNTPRWTQSVQGVRTRGIPYHNLGHLSNVVFSVGLWEDVADYDAVQSLSTKSTDYFEPPKITRVIPHGQYFPFCGMNFAFKREIAPLCYFPLMGLNSPYGRFDDIWFGIIAKKICDHLGYHIVCGEPFVRHVKASNVFNNLVKESPGIRLNEKFWEVVDAAVLTEHTPTLCMKEMGLHLVKQEDAYLSRIGKAIQIWTTFFETK